MQFAFRIFVDAQIHELAKVVEDTATSLLQIVQLGLQIVKRRDGHLFNVQRLFRFHGFQMRESVLHGANTSAEARQFPFALFDTLLLGPGLGDLLLNRILLFLLQPGLFFQPGQLFIRRFLFFRGVPQGSRSRRVAAQGIQIFLDGPDFFLGALDQPGPVVFLIGRVCQFRAFLFQTMKLTLNMPALLGEVGLPCRLGLVFRVEPVKAFIIGHKQTGKRLNGSLTFGIQILAGAGHHQSSVHSPQRCRGGLIQLVLKLPLLLTFPFFQGFQLALKVLPLFLNLLQPDFRLGGTFQGGQVPFLAIELLFLDVLDFLKRIVSILGEQQFAVFLVLLCPLNSLLRRLDDLFQAMIFLLQLFQSLEYMAQRLILLIKSLHRSFAPGTNVLQCVAQTIPKRSEIVLAAKQALVGLVIFLQLFKP